MVSSAPRLFSFLLLACAVSIACDKASDSREASPKEQRNPQLAQAAETDWTPTWNTNPDKSQTVKTQLSPTFRFAAEGFRGSPIFDDQEQKKKNAEAREAFVQSLPNIPECKGVILRFKDHEDADYLFQLFNGINGRSGRLQWILYRGDTLGAAAWGEGTGAGTQMGLEGIMRSVCSSIRPSTAPQTDNSERSSDIGPEVQPSLVAWEASSDSIEKLFAHYHYSPPQGFVPLLDATRRKDNLHLYEKQRADELKKQGVAYESHKTADGAKATTTSKTEIFPPYTLLLAARSAPASIEASMLPRVNIYAHRRVTMLMQANDPANLVKFVPQVKVLRSPEEVILSGRKFVRSDFQFNSGDFLSKFCTVDGDYLLVFDMRSDKEKDLAELVQSMQSLGYQP